MSGYKQELSNDRDREGKWKGGRKLDDLFEKAFNMFYVWIQTYRMHVSKTTRVTKTSKGKFKEKNHTAN